MKEFNIFKDVNNNYLAIKNGFSFPALILQWIWLLYYRFFALGIIFYLIFVILGNMIYGVTGEPIFFKNGLLGYLEVFQHEPYIKSVTLQVILDMTRIITIGVIIGINANKWLAKRYIKEGYEYIGKIEAKNYKIAIMKYLYQNKE